MKTKIITGILVLAVIALISGATFLAIAAPGSQEDPFITLSFLNNSFKPQVLAEVGSIEQEISDAMDVKIAELEARLWETMGNAEQSPSSADIFSVVTLSRNQSLTCSVGTEIMLRIGTATGVGSAPSLVNYTSGETLAAGTTLEANNMYLITIEGNGIRATADSVRVLVRGNYNIN